MTQNKTEKKIPVIGVTGGVGSGKSWILNVLSQEYGAAVILADEVGHELMEPGAVSYEKILAHFGKKILVEDARNEANINKPPIDRKKLADIVFKDPSELEALNTITHTAIRQEILARIQSYREEGIYPFIVLEAALLIEGGYEDLVDELWYIYVSEENRISRLMKARGYSKDKCRDIMARQLPDETFRSHCSLVVDNNGTLDETRESLRRILPESRILSRMQILGTT